MYYHQLLILGRATTDVETKKSKAGKEYCKFSIAVNEKFGKEKKQEKTIYYDLLIFGKSAKNAENLIKKGDQVYAYGRPQADAYMSKKDKEPKASISIIAENWQVLK